MKNQIKLLVASLPPSMLVAPFLVFAAGEVGTAPPVPESLRTLGGFKDFICTVIFGWAFTFLVVLAAIFGIIAAFKYLTAAGDPEKVKGASSMLIYAAVAVVAALFARGLPLLVGGLFGADTVVGGASKAGC